jgi:hypothetical protein
MPAPDIPKITLLSLDKLHIHVCGMPHPIQKNGKIQKFQPEGLHIVQPPNRFKIDGGRGLSTDRQTGFSRQRLPSTRFAVI